MQPDPSAQGLLLIPLIGGFLFLELCNWTRFLFRRQQGYRVFLWAAATGLGLLGLSRLVVVASALLDGTALGPFRDPFRNAMAAYADFRLSGTAIGALLLGVFLAVGCNLLISKREAFLRAAARKDSFLQLLLSANEDKRPILVTLKTRKAYVGFVISFSQLDPEMPYCRLLPTLSGYRTEDELFLELPIFYEESEELVVSFVHGNTDKRQEQRREQLQIVIKRDEIVSASFFDEELYEQHCDLRDAEMAEELAEEGLLDIETAPDEEEVTEGGILPGRREADADKGCTASSGGTFVAVLLGGALLLTVAPLVARLKRLGRRSS